MEKHWLSKEEEKKVKREIKWEIPSVLIPAILIVGLLCAGLYLNPKVCGIAAVLFLPAAGILFWLAFRLFRDMRRITEKRYVIKGFEVLETKTVLGSGSPNHIATLRNVDTEQMEKLSVFGTFYVLENNKFVYGIEIEGRKKRIYLERKE
jgi:hypothetical protein